MWYIIGHMKSHAFVLHIHTEHCYVPGSVWVRKLCKMQSLPSKSLFYISSIEQGIILAGFLTPWWFPCLADLFFFFLFFLFIYLFLAVLCLRFCARAFSSCGKWGPLFIAVRRPLTIAASLVAEHRLQTRRLSNCGSRA